MRKNFISGLVAAGVLCASTSFAEVTANPQELALIKKIGQDKLTVLNSFPGPGNLHGFVLQPVGGQPMIMYVDDRGEYAVYGTVINKEGENLTEEDTEKYVKKYTALKIADNLAETTPIKEGSDDAPYKLIVVADPNCSACNYSYNAMKPFIDKGELQVHWILVHFVRPDSEAKAAAIMSAKDPGKAMAENEAGFDMKTEEGGIAPMTNIPQPLKDELAGNMKFMQDTGISSTPTLIFHTKAGELKFIAGAPSDMGEFLKREEPGAKTSEKSAPSWWSNLVARVKKATS
ncbi:MAG: thiol:disulfide interchange protein DsbG [Pseudomonadota bacterium]